MGKQNEKPLEDSMGEMKKRFVKNFLDLILLQLIKTKPMWGYKIIKSTEQHFGVKLRHGALYPMLNAMETAGFLRSERALVKGRMRKIYEITPKGKQLIDSYHSFLEEQIHR